MRWIIRVAALLALSSLVFAAGGKTFDWTPPTNNVDGSTLAQIDIASYNIYCDGNVIPIHNQVNIPTGADQWNAPDNTFGVGVHNCHATTIATNGEESAPSNNVNFTIAAPVPNPPILSVGL